MMSSEATRVVLCVQTFCSFVHDMYVYFYDYPQSRDQLLYAVRCKSRPNSDMGMFIDQQPSRSIASIRTLIPSGCSVVDFGYTLLFSFIR